VGFNRFAQSGANFAGRASRPGPLPTAAIGGPGVVPAGQHGYELPAIEVGVKRRWRGAGPPGRRPGTI